tara:strand:+ start:863 stop:1537 length:675 start_codon:yes stop_codon:yes gene_type:complete
MKRLAAILSALMLASPVLADPEVRGWKTADSMGCMMLRECDEGVVEVTNVEEIGTLLAYSDYSVVATEANALIAELNKMGIKVYLAKDKYFIPRTAGIYTTVQNHMFLNDSYMDDPVQFIQTLRHEAWHAAQDAMAGTLYNTQIAIIYPEEAVPQPIALAATVAYGEGNPALPWEKEAKWAGYTENMTLEVLKIINESGNRPWETIDPTPLTRLWLERNGFIAS